MPKGYPKPDICMNDLCKAPIVRLTVGHRYCKKCQRKLGRIGLHRLHDNGRGAGKGIYSKA